ncbi:MAG: CDC48 family AAA ATPase [Candidatus Micrarchaeia archaeon]
MAEKELRLKVKEALHTDVGRGIARLGVQEMAKLGIESGDVVEIEGKKKAAALVWRAHDSEQGIIRLDGILRHNAGASVDDFVYVRKADCKEAKEIRLAPTQEITFHPDFVEYFHEKIMNMPLTVGNSIVLEVMGRGLSFYVVSSTPRGIVQVTPNTKIDISTKPAKQEAIIGVRYEDIGGLKDEIEAIREMVEIPMKHPEVFKKLGITPPKGVLLHGPPGCGKTLLAKAVASETDSHFIALNGPEIMSKWYGQSEENLRKIFEEAKEKAPSIIFIDEIDAIAPKREEVTGEVERRVVSQLLTLMDGLEARGDVVVLAATNRPNSIDPALRRPGRFDREIEIRVPDAKGRKEIFEIHTRGMPLKDVDIDKLVERTHGFTGADIAALCREAAMKALRRVIPEIKKLGEGKLSKEILDSLVITQDDFMAALKTVEPSAMREVMVEKPNVHWSDIGGLEDVKSELIEAVEWPIKYPETYKRLGIAAPKGLLLTGPPGCGKTLLAKAVATESQANFISVKGPIVLSKWVGESEKAIRETFKRAKQVAPCVIFFDELDSIAGRRGEDVGSKVTERVVDQLLVEMDGLEELHEVVVIGATNRPDLIDPALIRPGRFEKVLYVPMPDKKSREEILKVHTKKMPLASDVDFNFLVDKTHGFTGADIAALCREAGMFAIREDKNAQVVAMRHFKQALEKIKPSLDASIIEEWDKKKKQYTSHYL